MPVLLPTTPPAGQAPFQPAGLRALAWLRLNADLALVGASPTAWTVLAANTEVLRVQGGRFCATQQPARLAQALAVARSQGRCPLALPRCQRLPLTLLIEHRAVAEHTAGWHISLRDPDAERPDTQLVQALFNLTPSEAAVASALALGHSTDTIALSMGVQANTVLAHIKKVLTKTGTQRQAQLVSLLLRSVAVVGVEPGPGAVGQHSNLLVGAPGSLPPRKRGVMADPATQPCPSG